VGKAVLGSRRNVPVASAESGLGPSPIQMPQCKLGHSKILHIHPFQGTNAVTTLKMFLESFGAQCRCALAENARHSLHPVNLFITYM
jgi:hypothetical protein